jgi:peptidoglycan/LPS O-acetylase OafA/YrhL
MKVQASTVKTLVENHPPRRAEPNHMVQFDGLRAFAIAAVAFSHWVPENLQFGLPWGTGVQLFFVLSGFLITGILLDNKTDQDHPQLSSLLVTWRRFYVRRCLRIFPLFYMVLVLALLFNLKPIRQTWPWHFSYLSNIFYYRMGKGYFDYFGHFWSLAVEEQFYLAWPFLVLLLPTRWLRWALLALILVAPVFRIAVNGVAPYHPAEARYLTPASLDALGIGALFAFLVRQNRPSAKHARASTKPGRSLALFCLCIGLPGAIVPALMHHAGVTNSVANSIVDSLAHLCLVLFYGWVVWTAARGFPGIVGTVLSYGPIVYLGKISYGLYVFHLLTVPFLPPVMRLLHVPSSLENNLPLRVAILAALTLGLSMLSWHVFEKPLNDLKRYFPYDSNQTAGRVSTVTSANGYDSPLPDEILPLASAKVPPTR